MEGFEVTDEEENESGVPEWWRMISRAHSDLSCAAVSFWAALDQNKAVFGGTWALYKHLEQRGFTSISWPPWPPPATARAAAFKDISQTCEMRISVFYTIDTTFVLLSDPCAKMRFPDAIAIPKIQHEEMMIQTDGKRGKCTLSTWTENKSSTCLARDVKAD